MMKNENIQEIIEKAKKYDNYALNELCKKFYDKILNYIYYKIGNITDAEDLTSEVFIKMVKMIKTQNGDFEAWLYKIAQNKVIDYYRKKHCKKEINSLEDYEIPTPMEDSDPFIKDDIMKAISILTEEQQEVIILRFIEGYKIGEISKILGKSEESIKSLQFRAIQSLKKILGGSQ